MMVFVEIKHDDDQSISWINLECMVPETGKLFEIKTYIKRNIKAEKTYKQFLTLNREELFSLRDMMNQYLDKHFDKDKKWYPKGRPLSDGDGGADCSTY
jgi:hypothetical protein